MKKIFLAALLAVSLLGCGENDKGNSEKPRMVVPVKTTFSSIAPNGDISGVIREIIRNMNQGLLRFDLDQKTLVPALAQDMKIEDNGKSYIFTLREGVKFHNGKPITPEDVKYSFERAAGLNGHKVLLEVDWSKMLESVDILDDKTVKINIKDDAKNTSVAYDIADVFIVPAGITPEELEKNPIGAGAYKFVEYFPGEKLVMESFEDYYLGAPEVKEVEFKYYSEGAARVLAFKNGEIDFLPLMIENKDDVMKDKNVEVISSLSNDVNVLFLNNSNPKFADERVRKAIWNGIDMERIIKNLTLGSAVKLGSHMSPYLAEYYQPGLENKYPYNPEKAKELLKEAGYDKGLKFTLTTISENTFENDMALFIKEDLAKVGVDVEINPIPWRQYLPEVYRGHKYEGAILRIIGYADPYMTLKRYGSEDSGNMAEYKNPKVDELLKKARTTYDEKEREDIYKEIQVILNEDAASVFLLDQGYNVALSPKFTGYRNYPFAFTDISTIKVKK